MCAQYMHNVVRLVPQKMMEGKKIKDYDVDQINNHRAIQQFNLLQHNV